MRPDGEALQKAETVRADILALLREKRYEEALALLYRARAEAPANRELQKSIDQVKEFLIGAYAKRLGGLDRVAAPIPVTAQRSPDTVMLARYIDGSSTIGDVAQMCPLGQLRTLQVMVGLYTGAEPPRIDSGRDAPTSGLRTPQLPASAALGALAEEVADRAPDTARSASATAVQAPPRSSGPGARSAPQGPRSAPVSEAQRKYDEAVTRGTAAYVQRRYKDAIAAFEECEQLRPSDKAASVMVRRCERGLMGGG